MSEYLNIKESTSIRRGTKQVEMPSKITLNKKDGYSIYPFFQIGPQLIHDGYSTLVDWIVSKKTVKIDGYIAVDWDGIKIKLSDEFNRRGIKVNWIETKQFLKSEDQIGKIVDPFMGEIDSVWGKVSDLSLLDFYEIGKLEAVLPDPDFEINIVWGVGAGYASKVESTLYIDIPKNELLFRVRAGSAFNLGSTSSINLMTTYKRLYFVDWIVLNKRKKELLPHIDVFVDAQWANTLNWVRGEDLRAAATKMSRSVFRPRPWFDPGVWGGQLMKEQFQELARDESNYAWSFEIIAPENGVVLESGGLLLEITFDTLMFLQSKNILGKDYEKFEDYFPIRFDFLDTFDGGNLSVQCHPALSYIQEHFGEKFTQDETYYIMDCKNDAKVYLGFQKGVEPSQFRKALEDSVQHEQQVEITDYVQEFDSKKHQLFLIPNQTVHSSGKNNFVLEISATPYIFTFKMYDWLQRDKEGKPRPINIEHGFNNLDFSRQGERVKQEFISKPYVLAKFDGAEIIHYPTHEIHYYHVHRFDISKELSVETMNQVHVLMLVEGSSIEVEDNMGNKQRYYYAETFIVPAAAEKYTIRNLGPETAKVIVSFLKSPKNK